MIMFNKLCALCVFAVFAFIHRRGAEVAKRGVGL